MNEKAKEYWNKFWGSKEQPQQVTAEQFGYDTIIDELAKLIVEGKKTATCSAHTLYEIAKEPLPAVGKYTIILNSKNDPVAIIRTSEVQIIKMNEVSEELALAEGSPTYDYWWNAHKEIFAIELNEYGMEFSEHMLLVFEKFELIDIKAIKQQGGH